MRLNFDGFAVFVKVDAGRFLSLGQSSFHTGLTHTLFTLEDRYGLEVCECEDEVHLRVHIHKGRDAAELHSMLAVWSKVAAKLKAGGDYQRRI